MAETEACTTHAVDEDGKTSESKPTEPEQTADNTVDKSDAVNSEVVDKDGIAVNSKDTVKTDTVVADGTEAGEAGAASEGEAPADTSEGTSAAEPKTSFLDSFLHKSGLGKVMGGRKKKEHNTAMGAEENTADGGDKEGEKSGEEAEGGPEGEAAVEKEPESTEKEEDKKDKNKTTETKSTVRDFIRKPVARIFSHRSTEKKESTAGEPQKQVKVRSKSLDRLQDPEALNTAADPNIEEESAAGVAEEDGDQKASSSVHAKHMKRWHSFKKMMAQKTHKKSSAGGEDGKDEGCEGEGGGGDSSTLDSKESGQKRWKLKRSWTFQGLKRDPSVVGISGKAKSSDKESTDAPKGEEGAKDAEDEEAKAEEEAEGPSAEGGDEEKTAAAGVGAVTQHANEIWTSIKKRVIPKSKRTNTECAPSTEEDAAAGNTSIQTYKLYDVICLQ